MPTCSSRSWGPLVRAHLYVLGREHAAAALAARALSVTAAASAAAPGARAAASAAAAATRSAAALRRLGRRQAVEITVPAACAPPEAQTPDAHALSRLCLLCSRSLQPRMTCKGLSAGPLPSVA